MAVDQRYLDGLIGSRDELTQFVQEPKATEVPPAVTVAGPPPEPGITLLVVPDLAVYRDTVQVFGLVTPPFPGQNVTVYLDSAPFLNVTPGSTGDYLTKFTIERIASGNHTLVSTTGNFTSDEQVLVVQQIGTTTLLRAVPGYTNFSEPGVYCNGTVTANLPVRSAPVLILADGDTAANLSTAGDGSFGAFLALPSGRHTIVAQFLADGYPLNGSESDPVTVVVPAVPIRLADILIVAAVLIIIAIAAAGIWLVRHPPESGSRFTMAEEELLDGILPETLGLQTIPVEPDIPPEAGALLARYEAMLREHGLSEAARRAYLDLAGRIAKSLRVKGYRTLTPRELSGACAKRSYGGIFDLFVESYERIRYGGSADLKDREGLEEELQVADRETGREQP